MFPRSRRINALFSKSVLIICIWCAATDSAHPAPIPLKVKEKLARSAALVTYLAKEELPYYEGILTTSKEGRLFAGGRKEINAGIFWNKQCSIFIVLFTDESLINLSNSELTYLAAHEVCHAKLHADRIKTGEYLTAKADEIDADTCAYKVISKYPKFIKNIWQ